jgi:plastocyanin
MRSRTLAIIPLVAMSLVACSSGSSGNGGTAPAGATVIKAIEGIAWDAKTYTVPLTADGKAIIAVENDSSLPHNLHLLDSNNVDIGVALSVSSRGDLASGDPTLKAGSYQVICTIAGHSNMKATLTVG